MNIRFDGERILVGGASQGIGRACATLFAELGAEVTLMGRDEATLETARQELSLLGEGTHSIAVCDWNDLESVSTACRALEGTHFRAFVNNSGGPPAGSLVDAHTDDIQQAMQRLLFAPHRIFQTVVGPMKQHKVGRLINIVSTSVRQPIDGLGVSNTVRGATASWAKSLSVELGPYGITVNNVLPGATETGRLVQIVQNKARASQQDEGTIRAHMSKEIPAGRFGNPEEVAATVAYLASDYASYISGQSIAVDGGRTRAL